MTGMPFAFGVGQFTTRPWTFGEDVTRYAAAGVQAIEVAEDKLDAGCLAEQFALVGAAGLAVSAVRLALEPLNPTAMHVASAIWTTTQALAIIDAVGRDEVGLCLDCWNVWQQAGVEAAIARADDRIFMVHASDWRDPHSFADRLVPGDGLIPLDTLMRATAAAAG